MLHFAVIGSPINHSRSPEIYRELFSKHGIDADFIRLQVEPEELPMIGRIASGLSGFAVTMPHKRAIIPYLDKLVPSARACGSVNIVKRKNGLLIGHNTDGDGLADAVAEAGIEAAGKRALILGRGGAALSAAHALYRRGCRPALLVRGVRNDTGFEEIPIELLFDGRIPHFDIFINGSPVGMEGREDFTDLSFIDSISPSLVFDMVYRNDVPTKLVEGAIGRGIKALDGRAMLYKQALRAFDIWFGSDE